MQKNAGFTLIEVLIALMIIAIGITALLKSMGSSIQGQTKLAEVQIEHWVLVNAVAELQLNHQEIQGTQSLNIMGQTWYWRAVLTPTPIRGMQEIHISASPNRKGPFGHTVKAYRYQP